VSLRAGRNNQVIRVGGREVREGRGRILNSPQVHINSVDKIS
jgi:hypothetical protein